MSVHALHQNLNRGVAPPWYVQLADEYLTQRGITLEDFQRAGCDIAQAGSDIEFFYPKRPAVVFSFWHPITGELIMHTAYGRTQPFCRVRPLGPPEHKDEPKFWQPKNSGTHVYFARHPNIGWPKVAADPGCDIAISEGETRSLAGAIHGIPVISLTGVDCGQVDGKLHPDLECFEWRGRIVYLTFDSDVSRKSGPQHALHKLTALLCERGAKVFVVSIPPAADGSKQGLDDYLARHGPDKFMALLQSPETQPAEGAEAYDPPVALADLMAKEFPPTQWAWHRWILKGEVNSLYGDGGVGKSLLSLYIALAVAAGKPLFGDDTQQMPVLAFFAEDGPAHVKSRAVTALRALGLAPRFRGVGPDPVADLPLKLWCNPSGETLLARVDDDGTVHELPRLHALRAELAALGKPALLIVDSLADLFALNESLRAPVNAALKQVLGGLCREFGTTVLVLAHPSKASMADGTHYSGSTAFNNAVRHRLVLEIAGKDHGYLCDGAPPRILRVAKTNHGEATEKTLWYTGTTIMPLPPQMLDDAKAKLLRAACIRAALDAAEIGCPITQQRNVPAAVLKMIEKETGLSVTSKLVKSELETACFVDRVLEYRKGHGKVKAGYFAKARESAPHTEQQAAQQRNNANTSAECSGAVAVETGVETALRPSVETGVNPVETC